MRILDHLFLHANHQLYLSNLIVASVSKVKGFASLCNQRVGNLQVTLGDFDLGSGGLGLGQACIGQAQLGLGCVMPARHLLGSAQRRRVLGGEGRPAVVLLLGEREVRFGKFDGRLRFVDGFAPRR